MPRGNQLSTIERTKIEVLLENGHTIRAIGLKLNRSKTTIQNYLTAPKSYGTTKRSGRRPKLTDRDKRGIKRLAVTNNLSCTQIKSELNLNVTRRRINQILNEDLHVNKQKMIPKPNLTQKHRTQRMAFAEKYKFWEEEWRNVLFSDEKKFNLDGPDGFQGYWRVKGQKSADKSSTKFQRRLTYDLGCIWVWSTFSNLFYIS